MLPETSDGVAVNCIKLFWRTFRWCHDTQHKDSQYNDTQHNSSLFKDTQQKQHSALIVIMLTAAFVLLGRLLHC
jgi:hypothetical protein